MFLRKVRNAEATTEIYRLQRAPDRLGDSSADLDSLPILGQKHIRVQDLSADEQVNSRKVNSRISFQSSDQVHRFFLVHAERRRFAAHPHRAPLCRFGWIDP